MRILAKNTLSLNSVRNIMENLLLTHTQSTNVLIEITINQSNLEVTSEL